MKQKLYVPIMNSAVNAQTRPKYFDMMSKLDADTVFIALDRGVFFARGEKRKAALSSLSENISAFEKQGFEVGVWIQAFGFGDTLRGEDAYVARNYTRLRSVTGTQFENSDMLCPEDVGFTSDYVSFLRDIIAAGANIIMLDDDLCLSVRPGLGCFCKKHMALLEAELGESLDGKDLYRLFFTGGKNRYRDAYIKVMGDTHRRFAARLRACVDSVDPTVRLGSCAGYTSWDIEGITVTELTKILAGSTRPFLRLTGAPYWAAKSVDRFSGMPLGAVIEEARAQESFCRDEDIEIFFENDSYPRPRYAVPSSLLECTAMAMTASGGVGELGYFFDYHSSPDCESGYVRHRMYNKPVYKLLEKYFSDKTPKGVRVYNRMRKLEGAELSETVNEKTVMRAHFNRGAELLAIHSIPTVYGEEAECAIAFGEDARYVECLPKRLVTDIKGALILRERGYDVGLLSHPSALTPSLEYFGDEKILLPLPGSCEYFKVVVKDGASVLSEFEDLGERYPSAYRYTCGNTELMVYAFDAQAISHRNPVLLSYGRGEQLSEFCGSHPRFVRENGVYQIYKEDENWAVCLFLNISDDPIIDGIIRLGSERFEEPRLFGATGELLGSEIVLSSPIHPYSPLIVLLKKK